MKRSDIQVSPDQIIEALMAQIGQLSAELAMARAENTALWAAMSDAAPEPEGEEVQNVPEEAPVEDEPVEYETVTLDPADDDGSDLPV